MTLYRNDSCGVERQYWSQLHTTLFALLILFTWQAISPKNYRFAVYFLPIIDLNILFYVQCKIDTFLITIIQVLASQKMDLPCCQLCLKGQKSAPKLNDEVQIFIKKWLNIKVSIKFSFNILWSFICFVMFTVRISNRKDLM